jgi:hypothetical protein
MPKYKKSYRSIYSARRRHTSGVIKVIIGIIIAAAIIFVGYSIFGPLAKLFSGGWVVRATSSPSSSNSSSGKASSSSVASSSSSSNVAVAAQIRGAYLPKSYLSNTAALNSFITQAKAAGINLVVIDLKAEDGVVNYASKIPEVQGTGLVATGAPDASVAAKALAAAGIIPAARICAFQDPLAPSAMRGTGVMYSGDHTINWLDPTQKRWLNPYNATAQKYITDLAVEAVSLGYKQVFVDSLTFPTIGSPDNSGYYGANLPSKEQVIASFTASLKQQVNAAGGKLTVMMPGAAAIGQAAPNLGQSQDIFSLSGDYISPNLCPSLFGNTGIQIGTTDIAKPDLTPGNSVSAVAQYLKTEEGSKLSTALPFIQDFTNTALGSGSYKQYTASDVKDEIIALANAGISGYVLYNPSGTYDFSALK